MRVPIVSHSGQHLELPVFFYFRLCSGCERVFLCELCLYFPDNHGYGTPLFVFIGHLCIYLCVKEVSVQPFPPLFLMNYFSVFVDM